MAKEFKDWDQKITAAQIQEQRQLFLNDYRGEIYASWNHGYDQPRTADARKAVYEADDVEGWQAFRVALKGLTTSEKIHMLNARWHTFGCGALQLNRASTFDWNDSGHIEWIRIMNYIGALRRGGQLDSQLNVIK